MSDDLIEMTPVADIYSDGIGDVELLGDRNVRLIFFTWEHGQRVVVAKIVRPISSVCGIVPEMIAAKRPLRIAPVLQPN